jgi:molybdopterin/thiamine biosynthesis adenylyltransferase/rhodanese-related sulfurtransferase
MKEEWLRYSCQIALPGFDEDAQRELTNAKVLIVGMGGLGCPVAQYLVAAGIGYVTLADFDTVSVSNLHRQILYNQSDVGKMKATVAAEKLSLQNPAVKIRSLNNKIHTDNVMQLVDEHDLIVDCTDNIETKYLLNDACFMSRKPLVYGAIYQFDGQLAVFNMRKADDTYSANYRDLFPDVNSAALPNCAEGGVLPTLAGIIGSMQANEVIKILTGCGEVMVDKLLIFDGRSSVSKVIRINSANKILITHLPDTPKIKIIDKGELSLLLKNNSVQLVDVREEHERENNIGGENVSFHKIGSLELTSHQVVLYCQSGRRSEIAARLLSEKYPDHTFYSLKGGMNAWRETVEL